MVTIELQNQKLPPEILFQELKNERTKFFERNPRGREPKSQRVTLSR